MAAEVAPGIYIGCAAAARNREGLASAGITHIVNASPVVPCYHKGEMEYLVVDVHDCATEDISGERVPQKAQVPCFTQVRAIPGTDYPCLNLDRSTL